MNSLFPKHLGRPEADAVLSAFLNIFSAYIRRMRKTKEGEDLYSWVSTGHRTEQMLFLFCIAMNYCMLNFFQSESQDQVFLRWTTGETATMHILVVHAMVILLTLGPPKGSSTNHQIVLKEP